MTPRHSSGTGPATTGRRTIPEPERLLVWVRSGGCCAFCGKYLLEGEITRRPFTLGELAHIVGQQAGPNSPRGQVPMSAADRDRADNLMLVCAGEHSRPTDTWSRSRSRSPCGGKAVVHQFEQTFG